MYKNICHPNASNNTIHSLTFKKRKRCTPLMLQYNAKKGLKYFFLKSSQDGSSAAKGELKESVEKLISGMIIVFIGSDFFSFIQYVMFTVHLMNFY